MNAHPLSAAGRMELAHRADRNRPGERRPIRSVVHDPTSRYMGGVAGHAGMFTTADDLAKFCQMLLDEGVANGKRLFSAATIHKFTTPQSPADQPILRGLGWDIDSPYSANRGDSVSDRLLRPYGIHRHVDLDRPVQQDLRDSADQQRASASRQIADFIARPGRHYCGALRSALPHEGREAHGI